MRRIPMKNYTQIFVVLTLLGMLFFAASAGTDTAQAAKSADSVSRQDSTKNEVKFEYQVVIKQCGDAFFDIKNKHSIVKNTVRVQFSRIGGACTYVCSLTMNEDTLNIGSTCAPRSKMKHKGCFCIYCKITGLKKGVYYLNYYGSDGYKKITIK
jgi:hypothetical protein